MGKIFQRDTDGTLLNGLVECYKLKDETGFYAGLDMTNVGDVPFVSGGKLNNAASFDAALVDTYLYRSGSSITTVNDNFTICGWVNLASASLKGCFFYVGNRSTNGWGFGVGASTLNLNGNDLIRIYGDGLLRMNGFNKSIGIGLHFILMEKENGTWRGYVDNVISSTTLTGTPDAPTINTFIGAVGATGEGLISRVPTALQDTFFIWSKVLSANEKTDMWNDGNGQTMITVPSVTLSDQRPTGIKTAYIKTASEKWQNLGGIRNGELKIIPEVSNNTVQNNLSVGSYLVEAKFELLQTSSDELKKIDSIIDGTNSFLFRLTDAAAIPVSSAATEGWVTVSNTQIGVKARYIATGDPSVGQYVEILIQGSILSSEMDAVVKAAIVDTDFHLSSTASESFSDNNSSIGGTLFAYYPSTTAGSSIGVLGNNKPSGFATIEYKASSDSTYTSFPRVSNTKLTFDWIAQEDSCRRLIVISIDVNIEYEILASDAETLKYIDTLNETEADIRITLFDGKVFTFESKLGIETHFDNTGDFDKIRKLPFKHKGNILTTAFDGIVA